MAFTTNEPCWVCGKVNENKIEPRYGYVVCKEHAHLPPVEVIKAKQEKNQSGA